MRVRSPYEVAEYLLGLVSDESQFRDLCYHLGIPFHGNLHRLDSFRNLILREFWPAYDNQTSRWSTNPLSTILLAAETVLPRMLPTFTALGLPLYFNRLRSYHKTQIVRHALISCYAQSHPPMSNPASAINLLLPDESGAAQRDLRSILRDLGHRPEGIDMRALDRSGLIRELVGRYAIVDGTAAPTAFVAWPAAWRALLSQLSDEHFSKWFQRFSEQFEWSPEIPSTRPEREEAIVFNTGFNVEEFHQAMGGRLPSTTGDGQGPDARGDAAGSRGEDGTERCRGIAKLGTLEPNELAQLAAHFPPPGPPLGAGAQSSGQWSRHLELWLPVAMTLYGREFPRGGLGTRRQSTWVEGEGTSARTHDPIWPGAVPRDNLTEGAHDPGSAFAASSNAEFAYCAEYRSFRYADHTWGISLHADQVRRRTEELIASKPGLLGRQREVASCLLYVDFHHEYMHYMVDDFLMFAELFRAHRLTPLAAANPPERIHLLEEALCEGYAYAACTPRGPGLAADARAWLRHFRHEVRRDWNGMGPGYEDGHRAAGWEDRNMTKSELVMAYLEAAGHSEDSSRVRSLTNRAMKGPTTATLDKYTVPTYLAYSDPADAQWLRRTVGCVRSAAVGHWWRES